MAKVLLINRRKKRRITHHRRSTTRRNPRRSRARKTRRNPWFGQRRRHATAARKGWRGRRHMRTNPRHYRRRRLRRNPRGLGNIKGFINHTLVPGSVGAVGALGLDVLLSYVPLPAQLQTGMFKPVVRLVGAALLGMIAGKVVNRKVGEQVAAGATIVVLYDVFKGVAQTALPNLPLGGLEFYSAGTPVGEYMALPQMAAGGVVAPMHTTANQGMSEYVF